MTGRHTIRHPLGRLQAQKVPQREQVRAAPFDPALGVDALEAADHVHPDRAPVEP